jgi:hypothetical protein
MKISETLNLLKMHRGPYRPLARISYSLRVCGQRLRDNHYLGGTLFLDTNGSTETNDTWSTIRRSVIYRLNEATHLRPKQSLQLALVCDPPLLERRVYVLARKKQSASLYSCSDDHIMPLVSEVALQSG